MHFAHRPVAATLLVIAAHLARRPDIRQLQPFRGTCPPIDSGIRPPGSDILSLSGSKLSCTPPLLLSLPDVHRASCIMYPAVRDVGVKLDRRRRLQHCTAVLSAHLSSLRLDPTLCLQFPVRMRDDDRRRPVLRRSSLARDAGAGAAVDDVSSGNPFIFRG